VFEIRLHRPPLVCSPFLSVWVWRRRVWSGTYHMAEQLLSRLDRTFCSRSADNSWAVDAERLVDVLTRSPKRRMRSSDGSYARYHHGNLVIFVDFRVGVTTRNRHACFISPAVPLACLPRIQVRLCCFHIVWLTLLSLFSLVLTIRISLVTLERINFMDDSNRGRFTSASLDLLTKSHLFLGAKC